MNKKGQAGYGPMGMEGGGGSYAHPVLFLGIFVFVAPYLSGVININIPRWISGVGIALILIGGALSIFRSGNL